MAVLDFPASPLAGDKYPVPAVTGQPQYTYDGVKWTTVGAQVTTAAPASALPLMDAATAVVGTATKYAREDHVHPKIAAAPMDALAYSGMQINGSMEVSQELGVTGTSATGKYVADGWIYQKIGSVVATAYQSAYGPLGFPYNLSVVTNTPQTTPGAGDFVFLEQRIEGWRIARLAWGTANAQPITIGFWTAHARAGLYTGSVRNGASNRSYAFTYTQVGAGGTPQYNTVTIPGDTTGTWTTDNSVGISLTFALMAGTTYAAPTANVWTAGNYPAGPGQVNAVAAGSDIFRLFGVVVLPGIAAPTAAQSPLIMRPFDQELLTCQRYWWCSNPAAPKGVLTGTIQYVSFAAPYLGGITKYGAQMRVVPTATLWNNGIQNQVRNASTGAAVAVGTPSINLFQNNMQGLVAGAGNVFTPGIMYDFDIQADARL